MKECISHLQWSSRARMRSARPLKPRRAALFMQDLPIRRSPGAVAYDFIYIEDLFTRVAGEEDGFRTKSRAQATACLRASASKRNGDL